MTLSLWINITQFNPNDVLCLHSAVGRQTPILISVMRWSNANESHSYGFCTFSIRSDVCIFLKRNVFCAYVPTSCSQKEPSDCISRIAENFRRRAPCLFFARILHAKCSSKTTESVIPQGLSFRIQQQASPIFQSRRHTQKLLGAFHHKQKR